MAAGSGILGSAGSVSAKAHHFFGNHEYSGYSIESPVGKVDTLLSQLYELYGYPYESTDMENYVATFRVQLGLRDKNRVHLVAKSLGVRRITQTIGIGRRCATSASCL